MQFVFYNMSFSLRPTVPAIASPFLTLDICVRVSSSMDSFTQMN